MFASMLGKTLAAEAQGFEAGISLRDGLAIDVTMNARNELSAQALQAHLTGAVLVTAQDEKALGGFSSLLRKLRVSTDPANVLMTLRMTDAEVAGNVEPQLRTVSVVADKPR